MNHQTTAPMITEALRDEGITCAVSDPYMRVDLGRGAEILIDAQREDGSAFYDVLLWQVHGINAAEFCTVDGDREGAYVYASGMSGPRGSAEAEIRAMARSVNRSVRGRTGSKAAVLVGAPLASFLTTGGAQFIGEGEVREAVSEIVSAGDYIPGEAGLMLMRDSAVGMSGPREGLWMLKTALDDLWRAYIDKGSLRDDALSWHDVTPYMLRAGRSAVHDTWKRSM